MQILRPCTIKSWHSTKISKLTIHDEQFYTIKLKNTIVFLAFINRARKYQDFSTPINHLMAYELANAHIRTTYQLTVTAQKKSKFPSLVS
jgi:hypothetical protein